MSAMLLCDFYKVAHRPQYPKGTETIYSNWIPRYSRVEGVEKVVNFGLQGFIKKYLIDYFQEHFFSKPKEEVVAEYVKYISNTLGDPKPYTLHIEELHDLGYIPLQIKQLPEGTLVPIQVPMFTIQNTDPKFFWLTNYIETLASCEIWQMSTSATIAHEYRKILKIWAKNTGGDPLFLDFQGHDFSMRGMTSLESASKSGAGHLLSFKGTDTIPAIFYLEKYYNTDVQKELIGTSIPATEHSVMCAHGQNEEQTYRKLITEVYPKGFVSIVSDTWDLWNVLDVVIRELKEVILKREGKVVIRPDSGDPVKIICGDPESNNEFAKKGVIEILWEIFGGTKTSTGHKLLDAHIGCIYGDAITPDRCKRICEGLASKGFASTNMVYGIGSYTYQYNTRDTFGFALKGTACVIDGVEKKIFKRPITDSESKASKIGRVMVKKIGDDLLCVDNKSLFDQDPDDLLKTVFMNGKMTKEYSLAEIRKTLEEQ